MAATARMMVLRPRGTTGCVARKPEFSSVSRFAHASAQTRQSTTTTRLFPIQLTQTASHPDAVASAYVINRWWSNHFDSMRPTTSRRAHLHRCWPHEWADADPFILLIDDRVDGTLRAGLHHQGRTQPLERRWQEHEAGDLGEPFDDAIAELDAMHS